MILSVLAFAYCLVGGALVTADSLSAEKRDGTLGLLFLTDLKGFDVILGKLLSFSVHAIFGLMAVVPMMSLALLFGGVTVSEIAKTSLVLGNTLFFSLSVGMIVSTISQNERKAIFGGLLVILLVTAGPYELAFYDFVRGGTTVLDERILSFSPAFAFSVAKNWATGTVSASLFYSSLAQTHALAWLFLALACAIVPRTWKDRPKGRRRASWSESWRRLILGDETKRAAYRSRSLTRNPFFWLSSRERFKPIAAWVLIVPLSTIGIWIYQKYAITFYESALFLVFTIQVLLKIWLAGETCYRWIEDRRNNALELLLCTPVDVEEMVAGQNLALRRHFAWPIAATLAITILAWAGILRASGSGSYSESGRAWLLVSLPGLLADIMALRWVGMWQGLTGRGFNRAIAATLVKVLWLRWVLYFFIVIGSYVSAWTGGGSFELFSHPRLWLALAMVFDFTMAFSARRQFLRDLRLVAANPSDWKNAETMVAPPAIQKLSEEPTPANSAAPVAVSKRRWSRRTKWAVALATLALIFGAYRYELTWEIDSRLKAVRRAGFPVTMVELERSRPPLTGLVNTANVMDQVFSRLLLLHLLPPQVQQNVPGMNPKWPDPTLPLSLEVKSAIASAISSNQAALDIIHAAPSLGEGRYAPGFTTSPAIGNQAQALWTISHLLQLEVMLDSDAGKTDRALSSLRSLIEIGRSLDRESNSLLGLRVVFLNRMFVSMQWLLSRCAISDADLNLLEKEITAASRGANLQSVLVGRRCLMADLHRSPPHLITYTGPGTRNSVDIFQFEAQNQIRHFTGANDRDFIAYLDIIEKLIKLANAPWPERYQKSIQLIRAQPGSAQPPNLPGAFMFNSKLVLESLIREAAVFEARCRAATTSFAIERFRLRHGGVLPTELKELVPKFIPQVPEDPFDGQPIRFKRLNDGYCVYSIGPNGRDDGGAEMKNYGMPVPTSDQGDITFSVER